MRGNARLFQSGSRAREELLLLSNHSRESSLQAQCSLTYSFSVVTVTIQGSCLCGTFRFEVDKAVGPFEICHCNRCRKRSGAAGLPMVGVLANDYRVLSGLDSVSVYSAPILRDPPPYHSYFCKSCGTPLPRPNPTGWFEIPAGLFDDDPEIRPDKHIFIELVAPWDSMTDELPKITLRELVRSRRNEELPENHELHTHHGTTIKV